MASRVIKAFMAQRERKIKINLLRLERIKCTHTIGARIGESGASSTPQIVCTENAPKWVYSLTSAQNKRTAGIPSVRLAFKTALRQANRATQWRLSEGLAVRATVRKRFGISEVV